MYDQEGKPKPPGKDSKTFEKTRIYHYYLVETQRECDIIRNDNIFNCSQFITFEPNGSAEVVVTDIINPANYEVNGNVINVTILDGGDIGEADWQFQFPANRRNLVRVFEQGDIEVWELEGADKIQ
jgi:hypothetical protein